MNNGEPYTNDLLSAYHDGEANAAEAQAAEKLLAESPDARTELEDYERISAELRSLPDDVPPIDVSGAVLAAIRKPVATHATPNPAARNQRRSWRSLLPLGIAGAVAVAALAAVGLRMYFNFEPLGMPVAENAAHERPPQEDSAVDAAATEMAPMSAPASESGAMSAAPAMAMEAEEDSRYFADENARLPEGIGVGKMYSYLQHTEEGDIVVVEAYVVDVRQAVDQIQVLLARNQIPTTTVSTAKENSLNLVTAGPRNDLAVYVESDPQRVKVALEDLRQQIGMPSTSIQGIEVAGVLGTPASGREQEFLAPDAEPLGRSETDMREPTEEDAAAATLGAHAPQARGTINDNIPPEDGAGGMKMSAFGAHNAPATEVLSEPSPATPDQNEPPAQLNLPVFQTVLNVSNTAITQELRRQQRTLGYGTPQSLPELAESDASAKAKSFSFEVPGAVRRFGGTERRLRLLVVLQQQPSKPPAVQAPRP